MLAGAGEKGGFAPLQLQRAYGLSLPAPGASPTVAIIDGYNDPKANADLSVFRARYGLQPCTEEDKCFERVNQAGETSGYPPDETGLEPSEETSIDLDMVSVTCPECHLLLVEARSDEASDNGEAVNTAARLGASVINDSYAYAETDAAFCPSWTADCSEYGADYEHPGVVIAASAGDAGYGNHYISRYLTGEKLAPGFPATSGYVIAVGGTNLYEGGGGTRGWHETVWNEPEAYRGTGSGCSLTEEQPSWQKTSETGCSKRADDDVSLVAACDTPVSVYDSNGEPGWIDACGTSVSAPLFAGIEAHADNTTRSLGARAFYRYPSMLADVTEGNNGSCSPAVLCTAGTGWDGPSGWGAPPAIPLVENTAETEAATSVDATTASATLNGTVYPSGQDTHYYFEYGESGLYGTAVPVPDKDAGSGTGSVKVSQAITGLKAGPIYHYRLVAINSAGTTYGNDLTFTLGNLSYQSQLGSSGSGNGQFEYVFGVASNAEGDLWVADYGNNRLQELSPGGEYMRQFKAERGPYGVAIDSKGDIWVAESNTNRIQEFSSTGETLIRQFGSQGSGNGQFSQPTGIAIDPKGNVWVVDTSNNRVQEFSPTGEYMRQFGSEGTGNGQFRIPIGIAINSAGDVWVTDWMNARVQEFSPTGGYLRQFGSEGTGNGQFSNPQGITISPEGHIFVSDSSSDRIQEFSSTGEYILQFGAPGSGDSDFNAASFMTIDPNGNLWIADAFNDRVQEWWNRAQEWWVP